MRATLLHGVEARRQLTRLIRRCSRVDVAVAWATANVVSDAILAQDHSRLGRLIVGTSFYHTDPDLLDALVGVPCAKYMAPTGSLFHPKVYLFTLPGGRAALVGSHNLTMHAFTSNTEASVLIEGDGGEAVFRELDAFIAKAWADAEVLRQEFVDAYRLNRDAKARHHDALKEFVKPAPSQRSGGRSRFALPVLWDELVAAVRNDKHARSLVRLDVLDDARGRFATRRSFEAMDASERRELCGMVHDDRWGLFGSMWGHGDFRHRVNDAPGGISEAIACIPLTGEISEEHYDRYVSAFRKAFDGAAHGAGLASATRLLVMKRPDVFVPVNAKNAARVCPAFGVATTTTSIENYWQRIIAPLQLTTWWRSSRPRDDIEGRIWDGRAALLDALFYEP